MRSERQLGNTGTKTTRQPLRSRPLRTGLLSLLLAVVAPATPFAKDQHVGHAAAPAAGVAPASVIVAGEITRPITLDLAALGKLTRVSIKATAHDAEGEWSGVPLIDILRAAGAPVDDALRGRNLSLYVRVTAADGYRVVYALAELDPKFRNDGVFLADHRDGKLLDASEGPLRIIAPAEKRPGRWVRQVMRIDVLRAPE